MQQDEVGRIRTWAFALFILLIVIWQGLMAFRRDFNWDEYYFLTLVFKYEHGTLAQALQTFHVHLFSWLTRLPFSDSDKIVAGRAVMLMLHLVTLYMLFRLTRNLISQTGAVWATVFYASLAFVLQHATSFRADPVITVLLVGGLYGFSRKPPSFPVLLASSLAVGLAGLVSIKSAMYLPTLLAVAIWQLAGSEDRPRLLARMLAAAGLASVVFVAAFYGHSVSLGTAAHASLEALPDAVDKQFLSQSIFPGLGSLIHALRLNGVHGELLGVGLAFAIVGAVGWGHFERGQAVVVLAFAIPLLLFAAYRNSFPYSYVFAMAPVAVVVGFAGDRLEKIWRWPKYIPAVAAMIGFAVVFPDLRRNQSAQRDVEQAVHQIFPQAVPYIDRCGMIASFPWASFFMSTWGMESYLARGSPVFAHSLEIEKPVFLLATHPAVRNALAAENDMASAEAALLPDDEEALRSNFVHHWGPIWVVGKLLDATKEDRMFEIVVAGSYTFEAGSAGRIDNQEIRPDEVVALTEGRHVYAGTAATLRYGDHLVRPKRPPPVRVFEGF